MESLARLLLGRSAAVKLNLISRVSELTSDEYRAKVMCDYPTLLTGLGAMKKEYIIIGNPNYTWDTKQPASIIEII